MSAPLATIPSAPTASEPLTNSPVAARALEWAREWYPTGTYALTGVTDCEAQVLVEVDGDIRILRYEDLDRWPRCDWCGRPI
jgi:hypothetical protein